MHEFLCGLLVHVYNKPNTKRYSDGISFLLLAYIIMSSHKHCPKKFKKPYPMGCFTALRLPLELSEKEKTSVSVRALGARRCVGGSKRQLSLGVCRAGFGRPPARGHFVIQDLPRRIASQQVANGNQGQDGGGLFRGPKPLHLQTVPFSIGFPFIFSCCTFFFFGLFSYQISFTMYQILLSVVVLNALFVLNDIYH